MTGNGRGQIQYDFVVGVSILVMTIVVAFTFVPGLFGGVTEGRVQGDQVAADRIAAWLAEGGLGDPSSPGNVDTDCTVAFFLDTESGCGFSTVEVTQNVESEFGSIDRYVNVTIRRGGNQVSWGGAGLNTADSGEPLRSSNRPGSNSAVSTAVRPISIDGYQAEIVVRVW